MLNTCTAEATGHTFFFKTSACKKHARNFLIVAHAFKFQSAQTFGNCFNGMEAQEKGSFTIF